MNSLRRSCKRPLRRPAFLWLAGAVLLALPGCGQQPQAPASLDQMRKQAAGGPIPADALQKYMASHPSAMPPSGGPGQKPSGPKP